MPAPCVFRSCLIVHVLSSLSRIVLMALSSDASWPAARIRRDLFERITVQDVAFFDQQKTGELMNRLASDTTGRPLNESMKQ